MIEYLLLNLGFLVIAAGIIIWCRPKHDPLRLLFVLGGLVVLTAVFDPVLVKLGIVRYHSGPLLGLSWFGAPVEDFAYALAAATLMPALWQNVRRHRDV